MEKKAIKGILIGCDNNDGHQIWCKENNKLIISRVVIFHEEPLRLVRQQKMVQLPSH